MPRSGRGRLSGVERPGGLFAPHGHDLLTVGKDMGGVSAGVLGQQRLRFFGRSFDARRKVLAAHPMAYLYELNQQR